jgi:LytS/YehU family sensor histidine kinase
VRLSHLGADGVLGGDAVPLLGGVIEGISRCLKMLSWRHIACATASPLATGPLGSWLCLLLRLLGSS